jgi:decaprenylphospho-beta-D-ribofuranose 2-oxidase
LILSIGGTISTNVHGWQLNKPPIINTVEGFHLMLADVSIVYCTRIINSELFSGVIGSHGLLDVDLRTVHNKVYKMERWIGETDEFKTNFYNMRHDKNSRMFLGRFNIDEDNFWGSAR